MGKTVNKMYSAVNLSDTHRTEVAEPRLLHEQCKPIRV